MKESTTLRYHFTKWLVDLFAFDAKRGTGKRPAKDRRRHIFVVEVRGDADDPVRMAGAPICDPSANYYPIDPKDEREYQRPKCKRCASLFDGDYLIDEAIIAALKSGEHWIDCN